MMPIIYDELIRAATATFLPDWDWRWLKAQLFAESALVPDAVSPAGAQGIAQFMPATWRDVVQARNLPKNASPFDPIIAIPSAAWYNAKIRSWWRTPRPEDDRRRLTFAAYNAGFGNLSRAAAKAGETCQPMDWQHIAQVLPEITGPHAAETIGYVARIERYFAQLAGVP